MAGGPPLDLLTARIGRRHYAPHAHDHYAIGICLEGREEIRYRGGLLLPGPGSVVVIEPGETHTGGPATADGFAYVALYPTPHLLDGVGAVRGGPRFRDGVFDDPGLAAELYRVHRMLRHGADPLEAESRLAALLAALTGRHGGGLSPDLAWTGSEPVLVRRVTERLSADLTRPPTLDELAVDLGMSRFRVLRAFRTATGMPPYAWLAQHRVERARALLDAGRTPAEAAVLTGFADQPHLTRWFRRVLGVTPGAYQASVRPSTAA